MTTSNVDDRLKHRKERAKKAVALAMQSRWVEAVAGNTSILSDFPDDLEAYNRLGKALAELGRNREAERAFQRALDISPYNSIAKKNIERLARLNDDEPTLRAKAGSLPHAFIEESGKAALTALANVASAGLLLKMAPGHKVQLEIRGGALDVTRLTGEYLGRVEPRLATRLLRLAKGGNRYEATVRSVAERDISVIIREVYKHPTLARTPSFPSRSDPRQRVAVPGAVIGYEIGDEDAQQSDLQGLKDWSDDDTEPGDDEAFSPVVHRIINSGDEGSSDDEF